MRLQFSNEIILNVKDFFVNGKSLPIKDHSIPQSE